MVPQLGPPMGYPMFSINPNEQRYKQYKNLFEKIKMNSKKNYFSRLLSQHKNNAKKTWDTIKEAIGKTKIKSSKFPIMMTINKKEIFDKNLIANSFKGLDTL